MSPLIPSTLFIVVTTLLGPVAAHAQTPVPSVTAAVPGPMPATTEVRTADLVADYFAADPATASRGAIIVLGGSEGGLGGSRSLARRLAADGFDAIAVSYFGEPGQAEKLDLIPIEPIDRALHWLKARPVDHEPVAVIGVSKGGELALLTASRNTGIAAVVAAVPSNVVWAGIDRSGGAVGSSWTAGGQPVPHVAYDFSKGFTGIFNLYRDSLPAASAEAEIPVERIAGPILLMSGQADTLWPSTEMANRVQARLAAHGFAHPVEHLAYADAGHAVFGAPVRADAPGIQNATYVGGTVEGLVAARADGWPRVLAFLRTALAETD